MKTYIDRNLEFIIFENTWIPKSVLNTDYVSFLEEQKKGEAELISYVPPAPTWEQIRAQRNNLLKESDWIGATDAQPKPNKEAWLNYRQGLRDITNTYSSPEAVVWPQKPA